MSKLQKWLARHFSIAIHMFAHNFFMKKTFLFQHAIINWKDGDIYSSVGVNMSIYLAWVWTLDARFKDIVLFAFSLHNFILFLFSIILTLSVATSTLCYNGQGPSHRGSNPLHKRLELEDVSLKTYL
jgi:hypothetical protein